ncbi:unnamed protein product [Adineta steineri]|uniref:Uncharacterized protein n=1 Tax=Adineta steineri TaxID=433720 RepID=A0A819T2T8_9BILA|nr:unnamed protein product [Adineta steineri]CAF4070905.1 unnamed protein product [Adineta steineri]
MSLPCGGTACSKCGECKGGASCHTMDGAQKAVGGVTAVAAVGMLLAPFTGGASLIPAVTTGIAGTVVTTRADGHLCKCT